MILMGADAVRPERSVAKGLKERAQLVPVQPDTAKAEEYIMTRRPKASFFKKRSTDRVQNQASTGLTPVKTPLKKPAALFCTEKKCVYLKNDRCYLNGVSEKECLYTAIEMLMWFSANGYEIKKA